MQQLQDSSSCLRLFAVVNQQRVALPYRGPNVESDIFGGRFESGGGGGGGSSSSNSSREQRDCLVHNKSRQPRDVKAPSYQSNNQEVAHPKRSKLTPLV